MANTREIRTRIKGVQDIMKITNAMYLISSSKLKKARKGLQATLPYFETLQSTIYDILVRAPHISSNYFHRREDIKPEDRKKGYLVITADKGLAGAYNHNVVKRAEEEIATTGKDLLFVVGQVGRHYFIRKGLDVDIEFLYTAQDPNLLRAGSISSTLIDLFINKSLDDIYVIYTKMVSPLKAEVECAKILPLERKKFERKAAGYPHITFEPDPETVMEYLVPDYLKGLIYGILVEAYCSEHNARMTAMQSATDSARDMLKSLQLQYNRARQASITQEISEIVSGAKGLK